MYAAQAFAVRTFRPMRSAPWSGSALCSIPMRILIVDATPLSLPHGGGATLTVGVQTGQLGGGGGVDNKGGGGEGGRWGGGGGQGT